MGNYGTDVGGPFSVDGTPVGPGGAAWHQGKVFYVDGEQGADGHSGLESRQPMKTLSEVYDKLTDQRGDKIILMNDGATGSSMRLASTLTWSKSNTHLWGVSAPLVWSHRSRITGESGGATFTPLITVSGNGNSFANFSMFHDGTTARYCMDISGNRNSFYNIAFHGLGNATAADDADAASVRISGEETVFKNCTFGLDTIARSTTNSCVEIIASAARVWFEDCFFNAFADNSGALFVKIDGVNDLDRIAMFKNCVFYNAVESTATTMSQAFSVNNSAGGMVLLQNCTLIGATDWAAANNGNVYISDAAPTAGTSGIAIAVTR